MQDTTATDGDLTRVILALRKIQNAICVVTVGAVWSAHNQREGTCEHISIRDGEERCVVGVTAKTIGSGGTASRRERCAGEGSIACVSAKPGLYVGCGGTDLARDVRLEIVQTTEGDGNAAGLT